MKLRFSARAQRDVADILLAIESNNPTIVSEFEHAMRAATERIKAFPKLGRIVRANKDMRSVMLTRWGYQVFYAEDDDGLLIVTVRNARRRALWDAPIDEVDER